MKTSELIRLLKESDPDDEGEVSVNNEDIVYVVPTEAYYDGTQQVLTWSQEPGEHPRIVGGRYRTKGLKIAIKTKSIADVLWSDRHAVIDYSELDPEAVPSFKESDEKARAEGIRGTIQIEKESFVDWVGSHPITDEMRMNRWIDVACKFFDDCIDPFEPLPAETRNLGLSPHERRELQWKQQFTLSRNGYDLVISRAKPPHPSA